MAPVMKHKYEGTSGSTQGLRKLMMPASSAAWTETVRSMAPNVTGRAAKFNSILAASDQQPLDRLGLI